MEPTFSQKLALIQMNLDLEVDTHGYATGIFTDAIYEVLKAFEHGSVSADELEVLHAVRWVANRWHHEATVAGVIYE